MKSKKVTYLIVENEPRLIEQIYDLVRSNVRSELQDMIYKAKDIDEAMIKFNNIKDVRVKVLLDLGVGSKSNNETIINNNEHGRPLGFWLLDWFLKQNKDVDVLILSGLEYNRVKKYLKIYNDKVEYLFKLEQYATLRMKIIAFLIK